MNGVLLIDKPVGMTSRAIVDLCIRKTGIKSIGHAGTLDPFASGLLPICFGHATKLVSYIHLGVKTYRTVIRLGRCTETCDDTGRVIWDSTAFPPFCTAQLSHVLNRFVGLIRQKTPLYSARKVKGRRLYTFARRSESVVLPTKDVRIDRIQMLEYRHPDLMCEIDCSTGTYIRQLGYDIGVSLGCGAMLTSLRRLRVGEYRVEDAIRPDVREFDAAMIRRRLLNPATAASALRTLTIHPSSEAKARNGISLTADDLCGESLAFSPNGENVAVLSESGVLISICRMEAQDREQNSGNFVLKTVRVIDISR